MFERNLQPKLGNQTYVATWLNTSWVMVSIIKSHPSNRPESLKCDTKLASAMSLSTHTNTSYPLRISEYPQTPRIHQNPRNSSTAICWPDGWTRAMFLTVGWMGYQLLWASLATLVSGAAMRWILEVGIQPTRKKHRLFTLLFFCHAFENQGNVACKLDWSGWSLGRHDAWMCSSIGTHFFRN